MGEIIKKVPDFILPFICFCLGIISAKFLFVKIEYLILITLITFSLSPIKKIRPYIIFILLFLFGVLRFSSYTNIEPNNIYHFIKNKSISQNLEGVILSSPQKVDTKFKYIFEITKLAGYPVSGKLYFFSEDSLSYLDKVSFLGHISGFRKQSNPINFNYESYLFNQDIYAKVFNISSVSNIGKEKSISSFFHKNRLFIRQNIQSKFGRYSSFIKAIILGEKHNLDKFQHQMNKAGLSHILAVSGLHTGIIYLILTTFISIFIRKNFIKRTIVIIFLWWYAILCNFTPSVFRAVTMITIFLISKNLQRNISSLRILITSAFILLIIRPTDLFSIGFQMSFLAVLILLHIKIDISKLKIRKEDTSIIIISKRISQFVTSITFVSAILSIGLSGITLFYFNQVSLNGIIANLFAIPLIGFILPLAILIIILPKNFVLTHWYINSFNLLMIIFEKWINITEKLPFYWDFIKFSQIQFFAFLILIFSILITFKSKNKKIIFISFISIIVIIFPFFLQNPNLLKITCFDCGLGDLIFIEFPSNENMLIDSGPPSKNKPAIYYSALPYFKENGIKVINHLIITHAHNDHYGGLEELMHQCKVANIYLTDEFQKTYAWEKNKSLIYSNCNNIITVSDTMSVFIKNVKCKILHPDNEYFSNNTNNHSIVLLIDYNNFEGLFVGDLEVDGEKHLINKYNNFLDVDFLKVGHHGSNTSSSEEFIKCTSPEFAFISTPLENKFHFPHPRTKKNFTFLNDCLFISGKDGALQIITNGFTTKYQTILTKKEFEVKEEE